jgi:hypothetical protein
MIELEFRPDFETVRKNWHLMWEGKLNRPILMITIPKPGVAVAEKPPWGAARTTPFEEICDQALRWAETHKFLGDAVPFYTPSLIIGIYEALLGAEIQMIQESWGVDTRVIPCLRDLNSFEGRMHRESEWWEKWLLLLETMKRKLGGKMIFGEGFPGGNLDQLSALRGPTEFMVDFYDNPAGVHHAMNEMQKVFDEFHEENAKIMEYDKYGSITRHGFYCDGVVGVPQSDVAFSISKEHFDEFGLPYLKKEIARLDAVEYHLDGKGNLTHLGSICGIKEVGVIQWVPGSGTEGTDWIKLYEEITERGKGLWLGARSLEDAVELWQRYGASGRMVLSCHAETEAEAERYLEKFDW